MVETEVALPPQTSGENNGKEESREDERLRRDFKEAAKLGRNWMGLIEEREGRKYTPYLSSRLIPRDYIQQIGQKENGEVPPTPEDIEAALRASLGITLEAATQISEVRLPGRGQVRESLESLEQMFTLLKNGNAILGDLLKNNPQMVREEMRKVIACRQRRAPGEVNLPNTSLDNKAREVLSAAGNRIVRAKEALGQYLRH